MARGASGVVRAALCCANHKGGVAFAAARAAGPRGAARCCRQFRDRERPSQIIAQESGQSPGDEAAPASSQRRTANSGRHLDERLGSLEEASAASVPLPGGVGARRRARRRAAPRPPQRPAQRPRAPRKSRPPRTRSASGRSPAGRRRRRTPTPIADALMQSSTTIQRFDLETQRLLSEVEAGGPEFSRRSPACPEAAGSVKLLRGARSRRDRGGVAGGEEARRRRRRATRCTTSSCTARSSWNMAGSTPSSAGSRPHRRAVAQPDGGDHARTATRSTRPRLPRGQLRRRRRTRSGCFVAKPEIDPNTLGIQEWPFERNFTTRMDRQKSASQPIAVSPTRSATST